MGFDCAQPDKVQTLPLFDSLFHLFFLLVQLILQLSADFLLTLQGPSPVVLIFFLQVRKGRFGLLRQEITVPEPVDKEQQKQQQSKNDGPQYKIIGSFAHHGSKKRNTVLFFGNRIQLVGGFLQLGIQILYFGIVGRNGSR